MNETFSLTLVDLQLDAQNSYLFTYNTFFKILYMFRALPCSSSGGLRRRLVDWYRGYGATTPSHLGRKLAALVPPVNPRGASRQAT
jgi:hypothetical protein